MHISQEISLPNKLQLGKDGGTKSDEFSEKFQRGVGGVFFNPKIYVANFGNFKQGFLSMILIQNSNFRVFQQLYCEKSKQDTL